MMTFEIFTFKIGSIPLLTIPLLTIPLVSIYLNVPINEDGSLNIFEIGSKLSPSIILMYVSFQLNKKLDTKEEITRQEQAINRQEHKEMQKSLLEDMKQMQNTYLAAIEVIRNEHKEELRQNRNHYESVIQSLINGKS